MLNLFSVQPCVEFYLWIIFKFYQLFTDIKNQMEQNILFSLSMYAKVVCLSFVWEKNCMIEIKAWSIIYGLCTISSSAIERKSALMHKQSVSHIIWRSDKTPSCIKYRLIFSTHIAIYLCCRWYFKLSIEFRILEC